MGDWLVVFRKEGIEDILRSREVLEIKLGKENWIIKVFKEERNELRFGNLGEVRVNGIFKNLLMRVFYFLIWMVVCLIIFYKKYINFEYWE